MEPIRISKYFTDCGVMSRRAADAAVERGEVKINGLRWSARSLDPARVIAVGEEVEILEIKGVKLIVK